MISFYRKKIFFPMMNSSLGNPQTGGLRSQLLAQACGSILEIGFGSGLNLPYYPDSVRSITAVDPVQFDLASLRPNFEIHFKQMASENLQFNEATFDTVVCSFTLCSVADTAQTLSEIRRVLKPGGRFLFLEHSISWVKPMAWVQHLANPFYNLLACGCNVNRDIPEIVARSGLKIESMRHVRVWRQPISGFYYLGSAVKA